MCFSKLLSTYFDDFQLKHISILSNSSALSKLVQLWSILTDRCEVENHEDIQSKPMIIIFRRSNNKHFVTISWKKKSFESITCYTTLKSLFSTVFILCKSVYIIYIGHGNRDHETFSNRGRLEHFTTYRIDLIYTSSRIVRVVAASGLAQEFWIVISPKHSVLSQRAVGTLFVWWLQLMKPFRFCSPGHGK